MMKHLKKFYLFTLILTFGIFFNSCQKDNIIPDKEQNSDESLTKPHLKAGPVTDIDGNVYSTVTIGNQTWMVENLKTTKYRNGNSILNLTEEILWDQTTYGAYCWYNNDINFKNPFGALYNWYAASDSRNIAPIGWHVATEADWNTLINYLGDYHIAGIKLKEAGTAHWSEYQIGTNEVGFTALPSGARFKAWPDGEPYFFGIQKEYLQEAYFWALNKSQVYRINSDMYIGYASPTFGVSIRCVLGELPLVTTTTPSNITTNSASCVGNVVNQGDASVTERGVCWSTNHYPGIENSKAICGTGTGSFTANLTNLTAGTVYYVRAYAKSSVGVAYGEEKMFTTKTWQRFSPYFTPTVQGLYAESWFNGFRFPNGGSGTNTYTMTGSNQYRVTYSVSTSNGGGYGGGYGTNKPSGTVWTSGNFEFTGGGAPGYSVNLNNLVFERAN